MIDLTPLDVRKKKGDFHRGLRGYDAAEVDTFLDLVAERFEALVRENTMLRERSSQLAEALNAFRSREQAINEALVTAQQLREEVRLQSQKEAELTVREAKAEGERLVEEARRKLELELEQLQRARSQRSRFLRSYRIFLEGQLGEIVGEEERSARGPSGVLADGRRTGSGEDEEEAVEAG
jgi:DivIVA domain-containing protein